MPIPAATYNSYRLTTEWSSTGANAWSHEALWTVADGALGDPATHYYANPGKAPNAAGNGDSQQLEREGWLEVPLSGPRDVTLIAVETYPNSSARWSNTVLELSYQTPPTAPSLDTDLGTIAHEFAPFRIVTTGDLDSELAVYSSTGVVLAKNDDAIGSTVNSALHFDYGLPPGQYIAAVGGFNTSFASGYDVTPGASSGDFGLNLAGKSAAGALAAGQVAYFGFFVGDLRDVNGDNVVDVNDIDDLTAQSASGDNNLAYDLNADLAVNESDVVVWVKDLFQSWIGDANLDEEFNSGDLVQVLSSGTYEVDVDAAWTTGDVNGDGRANSSDLVAARSDGGYEQGPRDSVRAVPEPTSLIIVMTGMFSCLSFTRRQHRPTRRRALIQRDALAIETHPNLRFRSV